MIKKEYKYSELTGQIIGAAMEVHSFLGNGFQACLPKGSSARRQEVIYQRALAIELGKAELDFVREQEQSIFYEGIHIGTRRVDFLVAYEVMVELKAVVKMEDVHLAQGLNYLVAYNLNKGLLINFGAQSLEVKRLRHPKNKQNPTTH